MKTYYLHCVKKILYFLAFILSSYNCFSQSIEQLERLQEIKVEKEMEFKRQKEQAIIKAQQMNLPVRQTFKDGRVVEIMFFIGDQPFYYITDNVNAAGTISTDDIHPGGGASFSLTGDGETLGIWDEGRVRTTHQEFDSRVTVEDGTINNSNHSTHVAGTMIAEGQNTNAQGMAFEANLQSRDWNGDDGEMAGAAANGLLVSNHSYGFRRGWDWDGYIWSWWGNSSISNVEDYLFGFYDATAHDWDEIAQNAPYFMIVKSAGNDRGEGPTGQTQEIDGGADGFDCIPQNGVCKNILTIGAVDDIPGGYTSPANVIMSVFSDWGPADDGRIKPDLVANGVDLFSPIATSNSAYNTYSGTSMATPCISGSTGLLLEHQRNIYGNVVYRSSTMKALLIHTADEAGPNPGPDYMFGWGLANIRSAAELMQDDGNDCINIKEFTLNQGQVIEIPVVKDWYNDLKVTICWTDPPGTPVAPSLNPADRMLVNDIDLRVIGGGTTYFPWRLDRNNPANAATMGDNTVDNVEQVIVDGSYNGIYTIRISHKGTLQNGHQIVSLIVSGNLDITDDLILPWYYIYGDMSFWAHNTLTANALVIDAGGDVTFISGNNIKLNPGFRVYANAYFKARLDNNVLCTSGVFMKSSQISEIYINKFVYERNIIDQSHKNPSKEYDNNKEEKSPSLIENYGRIFIYPNPTKGSFTISGLDSQQNAQIEVRDMMGKLVYSISTNISEEQIDISDQPDGVYFVRIISGGKVTIERIVKQ